MIFSGEWLTCSRCGFKQKSDIRIESGWYKIQTEKNFWDVCPECAGDANCPKCPNCHKFYHERYTKCPWCFADAKKRDYPSN